MRAWIVTSRPARLLLHALPLVGTVPVLVTDAHRHEVFTPQRHQRLEGNQAARTREQSGRDEDQKPTFHIGTS